MRFTKHCVVLTFLDWPEDKDFGRLRQYTVESVQNSKNNSGKKKKNPKIILMMNHKYVKCQLAVSLLYSLDKRCNKVVPAMAGTIYWMSGTVCWGQDGLIFCDTPLSKKKKKFLKKCRWHFDFVLTKVEEFSFSQGTKWPDCLQRGQTKRSDGPG